MHTIRATSLLLSFCVATLSGCAQDPRETHEEQARTEEHIERDDSFAGRLELHPEAIAALRLEFAQAKTTTLSPTLSVAAELMAVPDATGVVGALVAGRVRTVTVNVGDQVSKGSVLVTLDSPEVGQARAELIAARARADVAQTNNDRERLLLKSKATSQRAVVEAKGALRIANAKVRSVRGLLKALGSTPAGAGGQVALRSPIDGVVIKRSATAGQSISPRDTLLEIADLRELWLQAHVYERDLHLVRRGQRVEIRLRAYPDEPLVGTVDQVAGALNPDTRTIAVRVVVPNEHGKLRPGMFAEASITGAVGPAPPELLVIPSAAVQLVDNQPTVFVRLGPGVFELRRIETGQHAAGQIEVRNGLAAGETVVGSGSFLLKGQLLKSELGEEE